MWNSRSRGSGVAFGPGSPSGRRRLAGTPWPAPPAPPEPEGLRASEARTRAVEGVGGASSPRSRRCARRAGARTAPAPAYARARARSRRVGQRESPRARVATRAGEPKKKRLVVARLDRKNTAAQRAGEGRARTSLGSPASAIAAEQQGDARRLATGVDWLRASLSSRHDAQQHLGAFV